VFLEHSSYTCKSSLESLVKSKVILYQILKKLVDCSLCMSKLVYIYKRDPHNRTRNVLVNMQMDPFLVNIFRLRVRWGYD
jgi:hypothetical protein